MEFDTNVKISTNYNYLTQSTKKTKRPTTVSTIKATTIIDDKKDLKKVCFSYSWMFTLVIVLVTSRFFSCYSLLLPRTTTTPTAPFETSSTLPSSPNSFFIGKGLSDAFSLQLSHVVFLGVFVVNPFVLKISSSLSTAQTSRLSNHSNAITISTTTNKESIIIQRRSEERKEEEKTLVKSTTIITTQNSNNNIFAESLPSEVESQAATTAAVVAVVDCSSYYLTSVKICQKVFATKIGCDFVTSDSCERKFDREIVDF